LKHKKNVDLKDVYDTKKYVYYKHLLITHNTKKYVCLEDNKISDETHLYAILITNLLFNYSKV